MAKYVAGMPNIRKVATIYDYSNVSGEINRAFNKMLDILNNRDSAHTNIEHRSFAIPIEFDDFLKEKVDEIVDELKEDGYQAIYLPLTDEVSAGFVMSQLGELREKPRVFGTPDWEYFDAIDNELKNSYDLCFTTVYYDRNDSIGFKEFERLFLDKYNTFPERSSVQGFDIMNYILHLLDHEDFFIDSEEFVRKAPRYRGIHQDFYYRGKQDNQEITIVRFRDGRIYKVNPKDKK